MAEFDPKLALEAAKYYEVPPERLWALIDKESSFNPSADPNPKSNDVGKGLTQLKPATAKELGVKDIWDQKQNVYAGARYLRQQYEQFGDWDKAAAAYNQGPAGDFSKANDYVAYVNKKAKEYAAAKPWDVKVQNPLSSEQEHTDGTISANTNPWYKQVYENIKGAIAPTLATANDPVSHIGNKVSTKFVQELDMLPNVLKQYMPETAANVLSFPLRAQAHGMRVVGNVADSFTSPLNLGIMASSAVVPGSGKYIGAAMGPGMLKQGWDQIKHGAGEFGQDVPLAMEDIASGIITGGIGALGIKDSFGKFRERSNIRDIEGNIENVAPTSQLKLENPFKAGAPHLEPEAITSQAKQDQVDAFRQIDREAKKENILRQSQIEEQQKQSQYAQDQQEKIADKENQGALKAWKKIDQADQQAAAIQQKELSQSVFNARKQIPSDGNYLPDESIEPSIDIEKENPLDVSSRGRITVTKPIKSTEQFKPLDQRDYVLKRNGNVVRKVYIKPDAPIQLGDLPALPPPSEAYTKTEALKNAKQALPDRVFAGFENMVNPREMSSHPFVEEPSVPATPDVKNVGLEGLIDASHPLQELMQSRDVPSSEEPYTYKYPIEKIEKPMSVGFENSISQEPHPMNDFAHPSVLERTDPNLIEEPHPAIMEHESNKINDAIANDKEYKLSDKALSVMDKFKDHDLYNPGDNFLSEAVNRGTDLARKYFTKGGELQSQAGREIKYRQTLQERARDYIAIGRDAIGKNAKAANNVIDALEGNKDINSLNGKEFTAYNAMQGLYKMFGRNMEKQGYGTRNNYFTHMIEFAKDDGAHALDVVGIPKEIGSGHLQRRKGAGNYSRDLFNVAERYSANMSRALSYKRLADFYNKDFVPSVSKHDSNPSIHQQFMRDILLSKPQTKAMRVTNYLTSKAYRVLNNNPVVSGLHYVQRVYANMLTSSEGREAGRWIQHMQDPDLQSWRKGGYGTMESDSGLSLEKNHGGMLGKAMSSSYDYARSVGAGEAVVQSKLYKKLRASGSSKMEALVNALQDPEVRDQAIKRGDDVADKTLFASDVSNRPAIFKTYPLLRTFLMFKRFFLGQTELFKQSLGTNYNRAVEIVRRGYGPDASVAEQFLANRELINNHKKFLKDLPEGVSPEDVKSVVKELKQFNNNVSSTLKQNSQIRTSKTLLNYGRMLAAGVVLRSIATGVSNIAHNALGAQQKEPESVKEILLKEMPGISLLNRSDFASQYLPSRDELSQMQHDLSRGDLKGFQKFARTGGKYLTRQAFGAGAHMVPGKIGKVTGFISDVNQITGRALSDATNEALGFKKGNKKTKRR